MLAEIAQDLSSGPSAHAVAPPATWWQHVILDDVMVWVRGDLSPWRMKQIRTAGIPKFGFVSLRYGIMLGQAEQEFTAGVFVEQRVDEAARSIDDVNNQPPHFVVIQARHFRPGDRTGRTGNRNI